MDHSCFFLRTVVGCCSPSTLLSVEPSSADRTREGGKKEGKTTAQRKGPRSEEVAGNFGDGERSDLIIVGESKSE